MPIRATTRDALDKALRFFDSDLRDSSEWADWISNGNYEWAIVHEDRLYPVKKIVELASGTPRSEFSGGDSANRHVERLGFVIVPLRSERRPTRRNPPWSPEELTLALDLYLRRGLPSQDDPEVVALSATLNTLRGGSDVPDGERYRNPNGVHMKLGNFRTQGRPGSGLTHGNRLEKDLWERFSERRDLLAQEVVRIRASLAQGTTIPTSGLSSKAVVGLLQPFKPKADLDYVVRTEGTIRVASKKHETLVNEFAVWLATRGLKPGKNVAVDLGIDDPSVIIEAEVVTSWPRSIREAVGQLYEYRYFQVASRDSGLIFLASEPIPEDWIQYLEQDRNIGAAWRDVSGYQVSPMSAKLLGLYKGFK